MNAPDIALIHADADLLVLHKPAGLLCVPGLGADKQDCLSRRVQARWPQALIVHRLDMVTSGLVLMALSPERQRQLSHLFERRQVDKRYEAVVHGRPQGECRDDAGLHPEGMDGDRGEITLPIRIDWLNRPLSIVDPVHGRPSHTRWHWLGAGPWAGTSRLELEPLTGRTHQLRLHLAAIGHPIVGDTLYAPHAMPPRSPRVLLHARELRFVHPGTGQACQFVAPVPF